MSFAQIQVLGNVGQDPKLSRTPDGTAVCNFSVAASKKSKSGEETTWYNCTAWRNLGEMIHTRLKKGQTVFVQGDLNVRQYTTKDGKNGMSLDITVDKFQFAGGKPQESTNITSTLDDDIENHPF